MTKTRTKYFTPAKIINKKFRVLEFTGDWYQLIGKPGHNFKMIVHGKARAGKSTLILRFAQYLAETFGKVLIISAEELMGLTMQKKIKDNNVTSDNIKFVATRDINQVERAVKNSRAAFVIVDSAQKAGFTSEHLYAWEAKFKNKALIIILQSDKSGNYKGGTEWSHDTDIKVMVDAGVAKADSRFDPPTGRMIIFKPKPDLFTQESN